MPKISKKFAKAVNDLMRERSLSNRAAMIKTGIDYTTINNMRQGMVPRKGVIIDWAIGMGENVNHWMRLAGYDPIPSESVLESDQADRIAETGVRYTAGKTDRTEDLSEELNRNVVGEITFYVPKGTKLSEADAEKIARVIRESQESEES